MANNLDSEVRLRDSQDTVSRGVSIEIIIPTLNEELTIAGLVDDFLSLDLPWKFSILVIDGGSTDRTLEICRDKNVKVVRQKGNGKGYAMREAVRLTIADIVVFIDGDATYYPADLRSLIAPLIEDEADMVVGSRVAGKKKGSITGFNRVGNKLFNKVINFAMKSTVTDSLSGYRALRRDVFKELVLFSDRFEIEVEMTVEALAKGYRIAEVPISYGTRKGSKTKLDPYGDGIKIARSLLFILMNVNPLKFFGLISLVFIVSGMYPAAFVLQEKIMTGEITSLPAVVLSALLFMTGTISLVVGLLSELVVRSRRRLEFLMNRRIGS